MIQIIRHTPTHKCYTSRNHHKSLCDTFINLAESTWHLLRNAHNNNYSVREETITEVNLLEIILNSPSHFHTEKLNTRDESNDGADWIWSIVGRNGKAITFYVQAKKYFSQKGKYSNLWNGSKKDRLLQVSKLIKNYFPTQTGDPIYPMYVFYNYFPDHPPHFKCDRCNYRILSQELLGCTYADGFNVLKQIRDEKKSYSDLIPLQQPWHCLVCRCGDNQGNNDLATKFYNAIIGNGQSYREAVSEFDIPERRMLTDFPYSAFLRNENNRPDFLNAILEGIEDEAFNEKYGSLFDKYNVDKIVVLQEKE